MDDWIGNVHDSSVFGSDYYGGGAADHLSWQMLSIFLILCAASFVTYRLVSFDIRQKSEISFSLGYDGFIDKLTIILFISDIAGLDIGYGGESRDSRSSCRQSLDPEMCDIN